MKPRISRMNTDELLAESENWGRKILLVGRFLGGKPRQGRLSWSFCFYRGAAIRGGQNAKRTFQVGAISLVWKIFLPTKSSYPYSGDFLVGETIGRFQAVPEFMQGLSGRGAIGGAGMGGGAGSERDRKLR
jgi:hypothetical protein